MIVSRRDFLGELRRQVSDEEREDLEAGDIIFISWYNRETVLRLLHEDAPDGGSVDTEQAECLRRALMAYLNEYMSDCPQGHKWIILACLYLTMVACEPMHPQRMTGWQKRDGKYYCRAREEQDGSVCQWCVCRSMES